MSYQEKHAEREVAKQALKGVASAAGWGRCCPWLGNAIDLIADDPYQLTEEEREAGAQVV